MAHLISFYLYLIVGAITPGPNTILSMVNASKVGLKKGIRLNFGMLAGILVIMSCCYLFSSLVISALPAMERIMRIVAAAYMLYLAYRCLRARRIFSTENSSSSFIQGATMQIINAKIWFLGLTAIPAYILSQGYSRAAEYLLSISIALVCFLCGLVWALFGAFLSRLFGEHEKVMNAVFSLLLAFFAVTLLI
ncbi:MAG: LysE family transporter [Spirochaetales bacterium]|nr:LysE family transporter [Spirochaetales bacterium]